ncbi:MAG TPA: hypothetical protein VFF11_07425, partial [Candidatus Binatia bacterium]|nr:hypothetical protein [Candidatus Binatia bacterium]
MNLRLCFILAGMLAFGGAVAVLQAASKDSINPYQEIVTRNVFGLVPIPTGPPPDTTPSAPLPKITPNGIMSIFGKLQVLFKVAEPGKPGNQEESYMMSVGDRQDDIEVQKIDEQSATITFNNHGTIQELALVAGKASAGAAPPTGPGVPGRIPLPRPGIPAPVDHTLAAGVGGGGRNAGNTAPGSEPGGVPEARRTNANAEASKISPEEQVIL